MKRRRRSMMQRVMVIIIGTLLLNFLVGCFALYRLMQSNTNYIYQLSEELMNASVTEMEQQLYNIQDILYDIIVSACFLRIKTREPAPLWSGLLA